MYKQLILIQIFLSQFEFAKKMKPPEFYDLTLLCYEKTERFTGHVYCKLPSKNDRLASEQDVLQPSICFHHTSKPVNEVLVFYPRHFTDKTNTRDTLLFQYNG